MNEVVLLRRDRATAWEPALASWLQVTGARTTEEVGASRRRRRQRGEASQWRGVWRKNAEERVRKITLLRLRVLGSWEKNLDAVIPSSPGYRKLIVFILL